MTAEKMSAESPAGTEGVTLAGDAALSTVQDAANALAAVGEALENTLRLFDGINMTLSLTGSSLLSVGLDRMHEGIERIRGDVAAESHALATLIEGLGALDETPATDHETEEEEA